MVDDHLICVGFTNSRRSGSPQRASTASRTASRNRNTDAKSVPWRAKALLRRRLAADLVEHLPAGARDLVDGLDHVHVIMRPLPALLGAAALLERR